MARTDPDAVRSVFDTSLSDSELQSFVDDAHLIVDEFAQELDSDGARSKVVEKYYAAELAALKDPRATKQSGVSTSETLQRGDAGEHFATDYGRRANDLSGGLLLDTLREEGRGLEWGVGTFAEEAT